MGSWASDTLSNDGAQDFLMSLRQSSNGWKVIEAVFSQLLRKSTHRDVVAEESALAAAEVVAAAIERPSPLLNQEDLEFAATRPKGMRDGLVVAALLVISKIESGSELLELWSEFGSEDSLAALSDLRSRLNGGPINRTMCYSAITGFSLRGVESCVTLMPK